MLFITLMTPYEYGTIKYNIWIDSIIRIQRRNNLFTQYALYHSYYHYCISIWSGKKWQDQYILIIWIVKYIIETLVSNKILKFGETYVFYDDAKSQIRIAIQLFQTDAKIKMPKPMLLKTKNMFYYCVRRNEWFKWIFYLSDSE